MSTPTLTSPNVDNLQVGKGVVSFQKAGDTTYRDLGNVSAFTITPEVTNLEHFSSREGTKKKDLVIILEQKCTGKITMEEFTAANLALMVYGAVNEAAVGGPTVEIFANSAINGKLRFTGTNDVGPRVTVDLYNVSFQPSGDLGLISDEFNSMEVTCDILAASTGANVAATGVYTATAIATDDTVTINGLVYTFKDALTPAAYEVKRSGVLATDLATLVKAINLTGVAGTDYGTGTLINPDVSATSNATTLTATAKVGGVAGNAITTTEGGTGTSWGATTLTGGVDLAGKFGVAQFTNVTP